ncbi:MAG TPA: quinohemoprotein amine dehydrogenase subunit alpha [Steroidobacteraceae bacterium]|nr:quinohemoprotein amine dehydrogenase subunit alpha [Steroidobacteraceae bacterium]
MKAATRMLLGLLTLAGGPGGRAVMAAADSSAVRAHCSGCHRESAPGHFDRISDMRKTPEGWEMTLFRMHQVHRVALEPDARDAVLRYLTEVAGLAPAEAAPARFALERRPNVQDLDLGADLNVVCGRCHSMARTALQRRDSSEWLKLTHTHVGQWPTLEYQQSGRDRFWWQSATTEVPVKLGGLFPLDTPAWRTWKARPHANLAGRWIVFGHTPGHGDYHGVATIHAVGPADYNASYTLAYTDGSSLTGTSRSVVYTGYEWRGTATLGGEDVREVFAASEDGTRLTGRWFIAGHAETGGDFAANRAEGAPALLTAQPRGLRAGATQQVVLVGRNLTGEVSFGPGTRARVVSRTPEGLIASVTVEPDAAAGVRSVSVGPLRGADLAVIYARIDRIEVEPKYAIARLGGGRVDPVPSQFEAVGYLDLAAADAGKPAAVRLGALPANWTVAPHDAQATAAQDVKFAGRIDQSGRFLPAVAGPNPARPFSGNNVGDLTVIATVKEGERELAGRSHLIVTVQRWNTPPIY